MPSIAELLRTVTGSGQVVTIAYNGGSRPGQARQVVPVSLSDVELIAFEQGSRTNKRYKMPLIASVELSNGLRATTAVEPWSSDFPRLETLAAYARRFRSELDAAGWYICEDETSLGVATYFKNGKPKKTPTVLIRYFDPSTETELDLDSGDERIVPKKTTGHERPWRVDSWRFKVGRTFSQLERAFALFIEEARASDPATAKPIFSAH